MSFLWLRSLSPSLPPCLLPLSLFPLSATLSSLSLWNIFKPCMKWTQKTRTRSSPGHPCFPHWESFIALDNPGHFSRCIHELLVQPSTMFFSVFSLTHPWFHCTSFSFWLRWGPVFQDLVLAATATEISIKFVLEIVRLESPVTVAKCSTLTTMPRGTK